jgi:hypothetical protein
VSDPSRNHIRPDTRLERNLQIHLHSAAFYFQKSQEALNPLVTEERYWALFYMPLYMFLHSLLNVLVHIASKVGLQKRTQPRKIICIDSQDMLTPSSAIASRYYNCCTDGSTSPGNHGCPLVSLLGNILSCGNKYTRNNKRSVGHVVFYFGEVQHNIVRL